MPSPICDATVASFQHQDACVSGDLKHCCPVTTDMLLLRLTGLVLSNVQLLLDLCLHARLTMF